MSDQPLTPERLARSVQFAESIHQLLCRIPLIEAANKNLPADRRTPVPIALEAYDASTFFDLVCAPLQETQRLYDNEAAFINWLLLLLPIAEEHLNAIAPHRIEDHNEEQMETVKTIRKLLETYLGVENSEVAPDAPGV